MINWIFGYCFSIFIKQYIYIVYICTLIIYFNYLRVLQHVKPYINAFATQKIQPTKQNKCNKI